MSLRSDEVEEGRSDRAAGQRAEADAPSARPGRPARWDESAKEARQPGLLVRLGAAVRQHPLRMAAIVAVILAAAIGMLFWWLHARDFESTDDAFVDARVVAISPQVAGAIVDVPVTDNQTVDAGGVLVRIDDRDYRASRDQAEAQVEEAQAAISTYEAQISAQQFITAQADKQIAQAQAALTFSQQENERYRALAQSGSGSQQRAQQAASDLLQKQAAYQAAQSAENAAERQIAVLKAQRENAAAQLDQARAAQEQAATNLARTVITAPIDGRVTKLTAAKGAYASVGTALMMFVPRQVWITANFKETQLDAMRPGQPVDIAIDAYPGRTFHGHVDSVQVGSGTAFSLLPAENATGNFVKIVQRVPVKIVFDQLPDVLLGPGMSVEPSVKVR